MEFSMNGLQYRYLFTLYRSNDYKLLKNYENWLRVAYKVAAMKKEWLFGPPCIIVHRMS